MRLSKNIWKTFSTNNEALSKAEKYVTDTLKSRKWTSYMLSSYYPIELRPAYCGIHLFAQELLKISVSSQEPTLALGKIDFWRSSIDKIYSGLQPNNEPLSICLHNACLNHPLTFGYFQRLLNVYAKQATIKTFDSFQQMTIAAEEQYSTLIALNLQLMHFQIDSEQLKNIVLYLGRSIGLCQFIRRMPYALRQNKFMLPMDLLIKHNLAPGKIWDRIVGQPHQQFYDVILQIASHAKKSFELAKQAHKRLPQGQQFRAFLEGVQIQLYLQNLQKNNFNIFAGSLNRYNAFKLPYRTYKAARLKQFYI